MNIEGISHVTFLVHDLDKMALFLCDGLGAKEVYDSQGRNFSVSREKFFVLGGVWIAAMEGHSPSERSYRHLAFKVSAADLPLFEQRLRKLGVEIKAPRDRVEGEGKSLYFYDFDNHLYELHTGTLDARLARYGVESECD